MTIHSVYFNTTSSYQKKYGERTVILIQVGAFYEVYGIKHKVSNNITKSHLSAISKLCNLKIAVKQTISNNEDLVMIGFRDYNLDKYIPILTNDGWTVPVINQDAPTSNTTRSIFKIFSPGTTFLTEDKSITNNIMCIWMEKKFSNSFVPYDSLVCGISTLNIYTGKSYIHEYNLKNFKHITSSYDELERFYSTYKPKEIIFVYKNFRENEIDDIVQFLNIYVPVRKVTFNDESVKHCEKQTYQSEQLHRFYQIIDYQDFCERTLLNEFEIAKQSFCYLLETIFTQNKDLVRNIKEPVVFSYSNNILLANHSLIQLNMINTSNEYSGKLSSVTDFIIHHCATSMGKRQLTHQILNPTSDHLVLNKMYDIVGYVKERAERFNDVHYKMKSVIDIEKLYRKIIIKKNVPADFITLYNNIVTVSAVYDDISSDAVFCDIADKYNIKESCEVLLNLIKSTFIFDYCNISIEHNIFCKNVYETIDGLESKLNLEREKLELYRSYLESIIGKHEKKSKYNLVEIYKTEKNGYSLQTTKRRGTILKTKLKSAATPSLKTKSGDLIELNLQSLEFVSANASNKQRIENPEIRRTTHLIEQLRKRLIDDVTLEFKRFVDGFNQYEEKMSNIIQFTIDMDIYMTLGIISKKYNYCRPTIDMKAKSSFVDAKQLRHILIEQFQQQEYYTPNDIGLGKDLNGILLFGTNAVGKSSLIKALGISVIMAQAGLFVPCSNYTFKPYHSIFTRILGNDNIFKGLSSFAVEMIELNTILKLSNENSLILGDELCSGTETTSAICIFSSGVLKLQERRSSFIFATHFHEICKIKNITKLKNVVMKHMKVFYNKETDCLEYDRTLCDGPGMNEYGLEVCKSLSMPDDFIDLAYSLKKQLKTEYKGVLSKGRSKYNSKKIKGICEICNKDEGIDTHHLQYQCSADNDGFINGFHKDHIANLINVCKNCHTEIHKNNLKYKKVKTTNGYKIQLL